MLAGRLTHIYIIEIIIILLFLQIGTSYKSEKFVDPIVYAKDEKPTVFVIGAFAHGSLEERGVDYAEETISISHYPLSAAYTCAVICSKFAEAWSVEETV